MKVKPSLLLAGLAWVSMFALIWLLVSGMYEYSPGRLLALGFFLAIAVFSSLVAYEHKPQVVNIGTNGTVWRSETSVEKTIKKPPKP